MITLLTDKPLVAPIASMGLDYDGVKQLMNWVRDVRPECLSEDTKDPNDLFPHRGWREPGNYAAGMLTGNEMLVELCGRKCYNSFGDKAGRKTNSEYIEHTQEGDIPHASILYQAKMSFFIAGVSRRVSHELIRHYVGADREEEGNPSQESTRYVEHPGRYVVHPRLLNNNASLSPEHLERIQRLYKTQAESNYASYCSYLDTEFIYYKQLNGREPAGMCRKRIYEAASSFLMHSVETSFIWTTNPIALAKLIKERQHEAADLEFQRLANVWKEVAIKNWPNLFPQPWMQPPQIPEGHR